MCLLYEKIKENVINIGTGKDYTIRYYKVTNKPGAANKKIKIIYDKTKPNGTPRKVMDISLAKKYGWKPKNKIKSSLLKGYQNLHIRNIKD